MEMELLRESIMALLESRDYRLLRQSLSELKPVDIAELFEGVDAEQCALMFRLLAKEQAAEVFSYLSSDQRIIIVNAISEKVLNMILEELYFDDKIDFLEEMPANFVKNVLAKATPEERKLINQFLSYPDNSAGSLMTIEFIDLKKTMTAAQSLERIRRVGLDSETVYNCYVLEPTRRLEGTISLRELVLAEPDALVGDLMDEQLIVCEVHDDQEEIAETFKKYDLMAIPVVDSESRLVGIITIDDIIDVIEQENTEDFQRMAAMKPSEDEYLTTGTFTLARRRIVWLLVLMISGSLTGGIIAHYEGLISTVAILTVSIPMLMDSGGNAGSQSSTLIIRGMALGEITLRDFFKVFWKELRVGIIAGGAMAVVNFARMMLITSSGLYVSLTVSITLLITIVAAKLVGGLLPLAAKALKMDPAIMAGPLITTIVDAFSLVIYFGLANALVLNR